MTFTKLENSSDKAVVAEEVKILTNLLNESTSQLIGENEFDKIQNLIKISAKKDYDQLKKQWLAKGQAIEDNKQYTFVTVDHLLFLPFFPMMESHGNPQLIFPDFIRHTVRKYLHSKYPIEGSQMSE